MHGASVHSRVLMDGELKKYLSFGTWVGREVYLVEN